MNISIEILAVLVFGMAVLGVYFTSKLQNRIKENENAIGAIASVLMQIVDTHETAEKEIIQ